MIYKMLKHEPMNNPAFLGKTGLLRSARAKKGYCFLFCKCVTIAFHLVPTGAELFSIESLVSSAIQHHSAKSYTSISNGSPFCRQ